MTLDRKVKWGSETEGYDRYLIFFFFFFEDSAFTYLL